MRTKPPSQLITFVYIPLERKLCVRAMRWTDWLDFLVWNVMTPTMDKHKNCRTLCPFCAHRHYRPSMFLNLLWFECCFSFTSFFFFCCSRFKYLCMIYHTIYTPAHLSLYAVLLFTATNVDQTHLLLLLLLLVVVVEFCCCCCCFAFITVAFFSLSSLLSIAQKFTSFRNVLFCFNWLSLSFFLYFSLHVCLCVRGREWVHSLHNMYVCVYI